MLVGDGANITVQTGDQGTFVVDTGEGKLADKVLAAIRGLTPNPIQFIANTSFRPEHTGGNARLANAGQDPSLLGSFFVQSAPRGVTGLFSDPQAHATIMAHVNVQVRLQAARAADDAIPGDTYLEDRRRKFHNGEAIEFFYEKDAVTDGDSLIHFRRADVIVAGDVFSTTQYPVIDVKNGGSVQGEIRALNEILNKTVYRHQGEGGTYIVPGHGYLADEHEVVEYRDMGDRAEETVTARVHARERHPRAGGGGEREVENLQTAGDGWQVASGVCQHRVGQWTVHRPGKERFGHHLAQHARLDVELPHQRERLGDRFHCTPDHR